MKSPFLEWQKVGCFKIGPVALRENQYAMLVRDETI